jgi:hypothetical protein
MLKLFDSVEKNIKDNDPRRSKSTPPTASSIEFTKVSIMQVTPSDPTTF